MDTIKRKETKPPFGLWQETEEKKKGTKKKKSKKKAQANSGYPFFTTRTS